MKKQLTAFALATALTLTPALAAESKFPTVNSYTGYSDVKENDWFYDTAKLCTEIGLMQGTQNGFEPQKALGGPECAALAARLREGLTGKAIPAQQAGETWYDRYVSYLKETAAESGSALYSAMKWDDKAVFEQPATRYDFLLFMALAAEGQEDYFPAINTIAITDLPDINGDETALRFYNIGILTGTNKWGTLDADKSLTRAEAAAMVARMAKPELRKSFVPADYSMFTAAYLTPATVMFTNGITADKFLTTLNARIGQAESLVSMVGEEFNWFNIVGGTDQTVLNWVKTGVLSDLGVTEAQGTQSYKDFDIQVYYARLISLTGKTLEPTLA